MLTNIEVQPISKGFYEGGGLEAIPPTQTKELILWKITINKKRELNKNITFPMEKRRVTWRNARALPFQVMSGKSRKKQDFNLNRKLFPEVTIRRN